MVLIINAIFTAVIDYIWMGTTGPKCRFRVMFRSCFIISVITWLFQGLHVSNTTFLKSNNPTLDYIICGSVAIALLYAGLRLFLWGEKTNEMQSSDFYGDTLNLIKDIAIGAVVSFVVLYPVPEMVVTFTAKNKVTSNVAFKVHYPGPLNEAYGFKRCYAGVVFYDEYLSRNIELCAHMWTIDKSAKLLHVEKRVNSIGAHILSYSFIR